MISKILGRKPLVDSYGYSAHARRHNSIASSGAGVSVDAVQQHLIKTIQCLTDISKTAVSYLFCPPTKSQKSNERYKGYIQARVPAKRNNTQKKNIDSHYILVFKSKNEKIIFTEIQ